MRIQSLPRWGLTLSTLYALVEAQTSTNCNPLVTTCPADPALGTSRTYDFAQGASTDWTTNGNPTYDSNGASFTISGPGQSPQLTSNWYIMFGHIDIVMKAAAGVGICSTMVLQSDDLDEVDLEFLGADDNQVQSNYFSKGQTTTYNRGAFHSAPGNQDGFHTYSIDYTATQVVWSIDGVTVRALAQSSTGSQGYPQTPMQIKIGTWSPGDPSNPPGTVQWAGGNTNYGAGPFTMVVKSVTAKDYSTGTSYSYGDTSGNWQSIKAAGGQVNSGGDGTGTGPAPAVTSTSDGAPIPFQGTHKDSSAFVTPTVWPWVPSATNTLQTVPASATSIPGLPSGWTVSASGKVVPPSAAPSMSQLASFTSSQAAWPPGSSLVAAGGYETITMYDQQGFLTTVVEPIAWATASPSFDSQGFLITPGPAPTPTTTFAGAVVPVAETSPSAMVAADAGQTSSFAQSAISVVPALSATTASMADVATNAASVSFGPMDGLCVAILCIFATFLL
ncbi:hypothetical protein MMC25_002584 [Agyrium rufum]|nr:hypothetical protein [Agyrium rufum]